MSKNKNKTRIDSILKPSAQTTKVCEVVDYRELDFRTIINGKLSSFNCCETLKIFINVMFVYGLRVSELINVSHFNISNRGQVLIKGCKGSNDRLIDLPEYYVFFTTAKRQHINPFEHFSRFYIYRELKKMSIDFGENYGTKRAITHQFRYMKIKDTQSITNDFESTANFIGHKNSSNTKRYANNKTKRTNNS